MESRHSRDSKIAVDELVIGVIGKPRRDAKPRWKRRTNRQLVVSNGARVHSVDHCYVGLASNSDNNNVTPVSACIRAR